MKSINELLKDSAELLRIAGLAEPERESRSLMSFATGRDHAFLRGHPEYELSGSEHDLFIESLERRENREPFQYITGKQEFYGLEFEVNRSVLIPRPETEFAVETGIDLLKNLEDSKFCDVGTGSGCIAISLLDSLPNAKAVAIDVSAEALQVAKRNAGKHGVDKRLELLCSDLFEALDAERSFDLIVSNPPYVPHSDFTGLQSEVKNFEPKTALTDDSDGLSFYRRIANSAANYLNPGGHLVMEMGVHQSKPIQKMLSNNVWNSVFTRNDLQGIPRIVVAQNKTINK